MTTYIESVEKNSHISYSNITRSERGDIMQIEIKIDETQKEPKIIILTDKMTKEIDELMKKLSKDKPQIIAGFRNDTLEILEPQSIFKIYSANQKVFAKTENGEYILRLRLYELEERLDNKQFIRISNSEIINLKKVKGFDLSFVGTICVTFLDGTNTFVSRRYVAKIKQTLGI